MLSPSVLFLLQLSYPVCSATNSLCISNDPIVTVTRNVASPQLCVHSMLHFSFS